MRCFLPAVPWLCCLAGTTLAWQARPENPMGEPATEPAASAQDAEPQRTVEEAIDAAIEAIDRLDAAENLETKQAVVDEITHYIEQVLAQEPGNPWLHYLYGRVYAAVGRLGDARDQLLKFAETREGQNEWQTYGILGDLFVGAFPRLAKPHYERAAALKPNEPSVLKGLSACMYKLADYDKAVQYAQEAVAADGRKSVEYVSHLSRMMTAKRLWPQAQQEAECALELARAEMLRQRGALAPVEVTDNQYKLLIEIAQARANEEPEAADPYVDLARFMRERAELITLMSHHECLQTLEAGLRSVGTHTTPALLEAHAIALVEVGREDEAIAAFERILTMDPDHAAAGEWLNRLRRPDRMQKDE